MEEEATLERLHEFATKHKGNNYASAVLMSFCAGECFHFAEEGSIECELCGHRDPERKNLK